MSSTDWASAAFTPPYTASGRSSLVAPPPWHYAGWLLNVAFRFDAALAQGWLPPGLGTLTGLGCVHFADWQASSGRGELLDPVYAQYKETILILQVQQPDGRLISYCPAIWVDQDISLLRGLLQGWPKKMGQTWLTRALPLQHPAAAPLQAGTELGASLAVKDRRLIEARATLTGQPAEPAGFLRDPVVGLAGLPDLSRPQQAPAHKLVCADITDKVTSGWHGAKAELHFLPHPGEDCSLLGSPVVQSACAGWLGLTIRGTRDV